MTRYQPTSPYYKTPFEGRFLSHYVHRKVPAHHDDSVALVPYEWVNRPDLMALDVYGDDNFWMAIPLRNGFEDPVFDLTYNRAVIIPPRELVFRIFS